MYTRTYFVTYYRGKSLAYSFGQLTINCWHFHAPVGFLTSDEKTFKISYPTTIHCLCTFKTDLS